MTHRAGLEAARQVGELARTVSQVADEFGVCWEFIVKGHGYTVMSYEGGPEHRIDWEEGDMFGIPLWCWHQHFNASESDTLPAGARLIAGPIRAELGQAAAGCRLRRPRRS